MLAVNSACRSPRRLIHLIEYKAVLAQRRLFTLLKGRDELLRRQIHAVREVSPARTVRRRPCYMCRRTSAPLCRYIRVAVGRDEHQIAQMRGNCAYEHFNILTLFLANALTDAVIINHDSLGLAFRFFGRILPELRRWTAVQHFMVNDIIFRRPRSAVNHEYLVKRCAAGQNLETRTALAAIRWRGEQYDAIGSHREIVWLLRVTDELLLIFRMDGHGAARIAFVRRLLRHAFTIRAKKL
jgi:hypothetical protein